ncbi:MAG: hypothetical protein HYS17_03085 [Micavibrio aeruginosavorus]|uniref:Uncharacterized protein n=1 Tax=Micavibrio aeruginosavorus TaxID=349221 RepID=A0A7T5R3B0_9BACT|nr:MAG: hypothetical protein HYS17_03085 [Micavibrio aeruginosavorus]
MVDFTWHDIDEDVLTTVEDTLENMATTDLTALRSAMLPVFGASLFCFLPSCRSNHS